jgi:hypothetical protein
MTELIVVLIVVALLLLPVLVGFDSRDSADWKKKRGGPESPLR